jgi:membrane protein
MTARSLWSLISETIVEFLDESPFQLAGALSFYTLLSLSPLVLVVVGVAGLVWSEGAMRAQLLRQIEQLVGPAGAETIATVLTNATDPRGSSTSIAIGLGSLLIGATTVFAQLQASLNQIWNVRAAPTRRAVRGFIRTRLLSLALVVVLGFLLLVSLVASAILTALHDYLSRAIPAGGVVWHTVEFVVSLGVIASLIALIFKFLPDVRIAWSDVWVGAFVTSGLFGIGKFLIGLYLAHASIASSYGAAGSLVVFLVWIYYSSLIVFLGAEFTQVRARRRGAAIEPAAHAVAVGRR